MLQFSQCSEDMYCENLRQLSQEKLAQLHRQKEGAGRGEGGITDKIWIKGIALHFDQFENQTRVTDTEIFMAFSALKEKNQDNNQAFG